MRVAFAVAAMLTLSVTRPDAARALALARWPHTDAERVRFHDRYLTPFDAPLSATPAVLQIEITTEFRRLELIAEEHERAGEWFGRGGFDEVDAAMKPWHGLVTVDAHLQLPGCSPPGDAGGPCSPVIPPTEIVIDGVGGVRAQQALRPFWYARSGHSPVPLGNVAEAKFDASAVGQAKRTVRVAVDGRELTRAIVDFQTLE